MTCVDYLIGCLNIEIIDYMSYLWKVTDIMSPQSEKNDLTSSSVTVGERFLI